MGNQLSEFMKQYKDKTFQSSLHMVQDELILIRMNSEGQVVSYVSDENANEVPSQNNMSTRSNMEPIEGVGSILGCLNYDAGCGHNEACKDCPINHVINNALNYGDNVIKKVVNKKITIKNVENLRHYRISTLFPNWFDGDLLIVIDDITSDYQTLELGRIEKYVREHVEMMTYDDIVTYCLQRTTGIIASEYVILYLFDSETKFSKKHFATENVSSFVDDNNNDELIDRKLWLQCVNTMDVVIDNTYQSRVQKGLTKRQELDLNRLMLCPVMNLDRMMGILVLCNKPLPYNKRDIQLAKSFIESIVNIIHYKKDIEKMRSDQQLQKNLAESVEFGMFRFISDDANYMYLDYMNESGLKILNEDIDDIMGKSDVFILKMDNNYVKNYLSARELSISKKMPFTWSGPFFMDGRRKWLKISMTPAHLEDRGLCWEGSFLDITASSLKNYAINQIHNQMETMIHKDTYTRESLLALLDDLKTTVNQ